MRSPTLRWLLRAAVSVVVVTVLLRIVPVRAVLDAIRRVSPWTWAASLSIFVGGQYLNALKLRLLLGRDSVSIATCVRAQFAGLAANLGLPGVAGGDLARAAYLVPSVGAKRVALASVADRLIDTLSLVAIVAVALPVAGIPPALAGLIWRGSGWIAAGAVAVVFAGAVIGVNRRSGFSQTLARFSSELAGRRSTVIRAAAISLVVQPTFVMTNVWLAREVGVTSGLAAWFVAWPLSKLIAVLPISLGGIGVREAALVSLLAPYGVAREGVLASGFLWQAVLAVTGVGGLLVTQLAFPASTQAVGVADAQDAMPAAKTT